jgi:hypothetical protein
MAERSAWTASHCGALPLHVESCNGLWGAFGMLTYPRALIGSPELVMSRNSLGEIECH